MSRSKRYVFGAEPRSNLVSCPYCSVYPVECKPGKHASQAKLICPHCGFHAQDREEWNKRCRDVDTEMKRGKTKYIPRLSEDEKKELRMKGLPIPGERWPEGNGFTGEVKDLDNPDYLAARPDGLCALRLGYSPNGKSKDHETIK